MVELMTTGWIPAGYPRHIPCQQFLLRFFIIYNKYSNTLIEYEQAVFRPSNNIAPLYNVLKSRKICICLKLMVYYAMKKPNTLRDLDLGTLERIISKIERKVLGTITGAICDQNTSAWRRIANRGQR